MHAKRTPESGPPIFFTSRSGLLDERNEELFEVLDFFGVELFQIFVNNGVWETHGPHFILSEVTLVFCARLAQYAPLQRGGLAKNTACLGVFWVEVW